MECGADGRRRRQDGGSERLGAGWRREERAIGCMFPASCSSRCPSSLCAEVHRPALLHSQLHAPPSQPIIHVIVPVPGFTGRATPRGHIHIHRERVPCELLLAGLIRKRRRRHREETPGGDTAGTARLLSPLVASRRHAIRITPTSGTKTKRPRQKAHEHQDVQFNPALQWPPGLTYVLHSSRIPLAT